MSYETIEDFANLKGRYRRLMHAHGALKSWNKAINSLTQSNAIVAEGFFIGIYATFINQRRESSSSRATPEGNLPNGKKFYAYKKGKVRAYFFYSQKFPNTMVVSHYIYKSKAKLDSQDEQKVQRNWNEIEK